MRNDHVESLVEAVKGSSSTSFRRLAAKAGVAVSTVTRIERGAVDPTVETLAKILSAAGYDLHLGVLRRGQPPALHLGLLASAWATYRGAVQPDWTRWRALLDQLAMQPDRVPEAIYLPPWPAGHPIIDALLAAVAEKLADDASLRRPSWTGAIPPLEIPWRPPSRLARHEVPDQFAARGLLVDTATLWRDPATIGV